MSPCSENNTDTENQKASDKTQGHFRVFSLEECGISPQEFLTLIAPSFHSLPWDYYDVRREQMDILDQEGLLQTKEGKELAYRYYIGEIQIEDLQTLIESLSEKKKEELLSVHPYRQKAVATLHVGRKKDGSWSVQRTANQGVAQDVPAEDFRSIQRIYPETDEEITSHPLYQQLILNVASFVEEAKSAVQELELTCWQMSTIAKGDSAKTNSPEGIHQDGADFIVSALVVGRENVRGGSSRIFASDKKTIILEETLTPGLGLFQEDSGSELWHDVTPIEAENPDSGEGKRQLIGFDIKVIK